jgi:hypothetical protein
MKATPKIAMMSPTSVIRPKRCWSCGVMRRW